MAGYHFRNTVLESELQWIVVWVAVDKRLHLVERAQAETVTCLVFAPLAIEL